jgi:hypothetical protein
VIERKPRRYVWSKIDGPPTRHLVVRHRGEECIVLRYTRVCSGCDCDCGDGYGCSHGASGCDECGYTGKRRHAEAWPIAELRSMGVRIEPKRAAVVKLEGTEP